LLAKIDNFIIACNDDDDIQWIVTNHEG
jgi:transcriptional/translational regulatory protein YebC/TACO1